MYISFGGVLEKDSEVLIWTGAGPIRGGMVNCVLNSMVACVPKETDSTPCSIYLTLDYGIQRHRA